MQCAAVSTRGIPVFLLGWPEMSNMKKFLNRGWDPILLGCGGTWWHHVIFYLSYLESPENWHVSTRWHFDLTPPPLPLKPAFSYHALLLRNTPSHRPSSSFLVAVTGTTAAPLQALPLVTDTRGASLLSCMHFFCVCVRAVIYEPRIQPLSCQITAVRN